LLPKKWAAGKWVSAWKVTRTLCRPCGDRTSKAPVAAEKWHKESLTEEANSFEAERVALKKILENKMRVSVEQILQGIDQLKQDGTQVPSSMAKQVRALHSLIAATVKAIGPAGED
jgi:hypothetical protein